MAAPAAQRVRPFVSTKDCRYAAAAEATIERELDRSAASRALRETLATLRHKRLPSGSSAAGAPLDWPSLASEKAPGRLSGAFWMVVGCSIPPSP